MSGICGLLRFDNQPAESAAVRAMLKAMAYRGPDGLNHLCTGSIALGQACLRTTLDSGQQDLPREFPGIQIQLVYDGRLDNRGELVAALGGRTGSGDSPTDAELVVAAYVKWGNTFPRYLEGDFALAIWDGKHQRLLCVRDHTGTRPFYYHCAPDYFAFATELPCLLALAVNKPVLNQSMVTQFLAQLWLNNEDTFWEGYHRLAPAHTLEVKGADLQLRRYWQPDFHRRLHYSESREYRSHYRELLADLVRSQSRSDQVAAFEVSGGLDSSALFAVASHLHRQGKLPAPDLAAYTLDFRGCGDADEVGYAQAVAEHCASPLEIVPPTYKPLAWYRERGRARGEFCGAPNGTMSLGLFARVAASGSRVLINGTGGDEWLDAGNAAYAEAISRWRFAALPSLMRTQAQTDGWHYAVRCAARNTLAGILPTRIKELLRQVRASEDEDVHRLSPQFRQQLQQLQQQHQNRSAGLRLRAPWQLPLWQQANSSHALLAHETMEVLAAEAGLELRRPYWSRRLVEFSISLPRHVLSVPGENRSLHRLAMSGLLPGQVLTRADKAEFSAAFQGLTGAAATAMSGGEPRVHPEWLNTESLNALLAENAEAEDGCLNWALWYLYCCAAVSG